MRTYYLAAHLFLALHSQSVSAEYANTTSSSGPVSTTSISGALVNATLLNNPPGWLPPNATQPIVLTGSVITQDNRSMLSVSEFANVELYLGSLHGSGVIELTSSPAAPTVDDDASGAASPRCTPKTQSISASLFTGNQSSTIRSDNATSLAALPTPTSLSNNTNFNISRLSTFAAPALQSSSDEPAGKPRASSYRSLVAATASLCFIVFL